MILLEKMKMNLKLTINSSSNDPDLPSPTTLYHQSSVSADDTTITISTTKTLYRFNLTHTCSSGYQHSGEDMMICSSQSCLNFYIQCAPLDTLKLNTGRWKGFDYVLSRSNKLA